MTKLSTYDLLAGYDLEDAEAMAVVMPAAQQLRNLLGMLIYAGLLPEIQKIPSLVEPTLVKIAEYNATVKNIHSEMRAIINAVKTSKPDLVKEIVARLLTETIFVQDAAEQSKQLITLDNLVSEILVQDVTTDTIASYCATLHVLDAIQLHPSFTLAANKEESRQQSKDKLSQGHAALNTKLQTYFELAQKKFKQAEVGYYDRMLTLGVKEQLAFLQSKEATDFRSIVADLYAALYTTSTDGSAVLDDLLTCSTSDTASRQLLCKVACTQASFIKAQQEGLSSERLLVAHVASRVLEGESFHTKLKGEIKIAAGDIDAAIARERQALVGLNQIPLQGRLLDNVRSILIRVIHMRILDRYIKLKNKEENGIVKMFANAKHAVLTTTEITTAIAALETYIDKALDADDCASISPTPAMALISASNKLLALHMLIEGIGRIVDIENRSMERTVCAMVDRLKQKAEDRTKQLLESIHNTGSYFTADVKQSYDTLAAMDLQSMPQAGAFVQITLAYLQAYLLLKEAKQLTLPSQRDALTTGISTGIKQWIDIAQRSASYQQAVAVSKRDQTFTSTMQAIDDMQRAYLEQLKQFITNNKAQLQEEKALDQLKKQLLETIGSIDSQQLKLIILQIVQLLPSRSAGTARPQSMNFATNPHLTFAPAPPTHQSVPANMLLLLNEDALRTGEAAHSYSPMN